MGLSEPRFLPGGSAVIGRSYKPGREAYTRAVRGQRSALEIEFHDGQPPTAALIVCEHIGSSTVNRQEHPLAVSGSTVSGEIEFAQCGVTRFRLAHRQAGAWFWDSVPWTYVIVDPPHLSALRVYTLIPTASGTISQWIGELDRIRDLGFNTVHLLPVTAMDASASPYSTADHFAIDASYLDPGDKRDGLAQFASFVDAARRRQLRLCLDLTFNSVGVTGKISRCRPEWLHEDPDETDGHRRSGWSDGRRWHKWRDLASVDYETPVGRDELWQYMIDYARLWAGYAAATDGMVRLDNLHAGYAPFMSQMVRRLRDDFPQLIVLGEMFAEEPQIDRLVLRYGLNLLLATPWEHNFVPQLRRYLAYLHSKAGRWQYLCPLNSHDSGTPTSEFGDVRTTLPRLVVSLFFGPGPSGLSQGAEYGAPLPVTFIGRHGWVPRTGAASFAGNIAELNRIGSSFSCFQQPGNLSFIDSGHDAVLGGCRLDPGTRRPAFLIFANFDTCREQRLRVELGPQSVAPGSQLRDALTGESLAVDQVLEVQLPPCGIRLLQVVAGR